MLDTFFFFLNWWILCIKRHFAQMSLAKAKHVSLDSEILMSFLVNTNRSQLGKCWDIKTTFVHSGINEGLPLLLSLDLRQVFLSRRHHPLTSAFLPPWRRFTFEWCRCCCCSLISWVRPLPRSRSLVPLPLFYLFVNLPLPSLCLSWKADLCAGPAIMGNSPQSVEFSLEESSGYVPVNVWFCGEKS